MLPDTPPKYCSCYKNTHWVCPFPDSLQSAHDRKTKRTIAQCTDSSPPERRRNATFRALHAPKYPAAVQIPLDTEASDKAAYITGQTISVDGGMHI